MNVERPSWFYKGMVIFCSLVGLMASSMITGLTIQLLQTAMIQTDFQYLLIGFLIVTNGSLFLYSTALWLSLLFKLKGGITHDSR